MSPANLRFDLSSQIVAKHWAETNFPQKANPKILKALGMFVRNYEGGVKRFRVLSPVALH
ncbi:MAG: hypothetical protein GTO24_04275 [candidate division Zixibacteria bacterium]|nr:hypothetical protein [candidate division Zixibacteria bacterium]